MKLTNELQNKLGNAKSEDEVNPWRNKAECRRSGCHS